MSSLIWKKLVILGDSNTQYGSTNWLGLLSDKLQRMCDVVNRGFSGYNTRHMKLIIPKLMSEFNLEELAGVVILLGSNDSAENEIQHVPLVDFEQNYQWIIDYLLGIGLKKDQIVIVTPPRIVDEVWQANVKAQYNSDSSHFDRLVKLYAEKCRELALKNKIDYFDLYAAMQASKRDLKDYLHDGLHLSVTGGQLLSDGLWPILNRKLIVSGEVKMNFPLWREISYNEDLKDLPQ